MKLALLSDLHANLQALEACLAHARTQGADQFAFLGDLVGYGGQPAEVLDHVQALATQGAVVLKGNHDRMFTRFLKDPGEQEPGLRSEYSWLHPKLGGATTLASYGVAKAADRLRVERWVRSRMISPMLSRCRATTRLRKWPNMRLT